LLACTALVVEHDGSLGRTAHVGHDEADAWTKRARIPLDLGDYPARLAPACRLIGEIGVVPSDIAERFSAAASHCVATHLAWRRRVTLNRFPADYPTHRRIVRKRSASFTSSYPARRPNTDCRSKPTSAAAVLAGAH